MNTLVKIENISLPDLARHNLPSLPAWLAASLTALETNLQLINGAFMEVQTLSKAMMPTEAQRREIESHILSLRSSLGETAERGEEWAKRTTLAVTKLVTVLAGGNKGSEAASEAKGDAYAEALDDVPCWAVEVVARAWFRGECGMDEKGKFYDYQWPPAPATLRRLAREREWTVKSRIEQLENLLFAREYVDCSSELERGRLAYIGILKAAADGSANQNFEGAIELSRQVVGEPPSPLKRMPLSNGGDNAPVV